MSIFTSTILASEGYQIVNELPMPAFVYGVITLSIFIVMGLVTYSFRDVAHRHAEKAEAYAREHGAEDK